MARTRASKGSQAAKAGSSTTAVTVTSSIHILSDQVPNPPKLFILPNVATSDPRIVSLPHPRYTKSTRYLLCPETGLYEFTRIAAPKATPRSWLVESRLATFGCDGSKIRSNVSAQLLMSADLYVASPFDPLFLLLAGLASQLQQTKRMFLSMDDHLDSVGEGSSHLSDMLRSGKMRSWLESRMGDVCDSVDCGDEKMYRLNESNVLQEILSKARRIAASSLPSSMEEKFVRKALEAPISSIARDTSAIIGSGQIAGEGTDPGAPTPAAEMADSQSFASKADTSSSLVSEASAAATSVPEDTVSDPVSSVQASDEVVALQRLRVAFDFICSSYVPAAVADVMQKLLQDEKTSVDFRPLTDYLDQLKKLRQDALASRSDYSRKRARDEDEDDRAQKRRRKEDEEKRKKANESRGVRELKKVNVSGMKKMSDFFKKK